MYWTDLHVSKFLDAVVIGGLRCTSPTIISLFENSSILARLLKQYPRHSKVAFVQREPRAGLHYGLCQAFRITFYFSDLRRYAYCKAQWK